MNHLKRYRLALIHCDKASSYYHVSAFNLKQALSLTGCNAVAVSWSPVNAGGEV